MSVGAFSHCLSDDPQDAVDRLPILAIGGPPNPEHTNGRATCGLRSLLSEVAQAQLVIR